MKAKEIRETDKVSLKEKLTELKKELVKLNAQISTGTSIKNPGQVKKVKKTIARINTINSQNKKEKAKKSEVDKKG